MTDRVRDTIRAANDEGRAALIAYLPAGFPDLDTSRDCLVAAAEAGADVLEIGFPFSDPMMDGPTIQAAAQVALDRGITVDDDFAVARRVTEAVHVAALVMTYVTLPAARGYQRFADDAEAAGLHGVILPDLPVDEARPWLDAADRARLSTVFMAAQTSSDRRLDRLVSLASGFVYATSVLGVTGTRDSVADARDLVRRVRDRTDLPVCVGIGVSDADQAADVATYADGVIVGSAIVRAAGDRDPADAPGRVSDLVASLREGVERGSRDRSFA